MTLLEQIRYFNTLTSRYNDLCHNKGNEIEINLICKELKKTFRSFPKEVQDLILGMDPEIYELIHSIY